MKGIDRNDIKFVNEAFKNNNHNLVFSKLYENNKLPSNRLRFLIENFFDNIYTYSVLINALLKDNDLELLNIIFENYFLFDSITQIKFKYTNFE